MIYLMPHFIDDPLHAAFRSGTPAAGVHHSMMPIRCSPLLPGTLWLTIRFMKIAGGGSVASCVKSLETRKICYKPACT